MREEQTPKYATYGNNLRALRKKSNMTRADLSAICGVSPTTLVNYERGTRIPFADTASRIAHAFNTTIEEMFGLPAPKRLTHVPSFSSLSFSERLQLICREASVLAENDLTEEQLLELSIMFTDASLKGQRMLYERLIANGGFSISESDKAVAKANATEDAVRILKSAISSLSQLANLQRCDTRVLTTIYTERDCQSPLCSHYPQNSIADQIWQSRHDSH